MTESLCQFAAFAYYIQDSNNQIFFLFILYLTDLKILVHHYKEQLMLKSSLMIIDVYLS